MNLNSAGLDLKDIHQQPQEAMTLYAVVLAWKPARIFEVGTFCGGSARIICQAMIDNGTGATPERVFLIDPMLRLSNDNAEFLRGKATTIEEGFPRAFVRLPDQDRGFDMAFH